MAVAPNTLIRLLKIPFLMDNKNQLTFTNLEAQTNYFLGREYVEVDETEYTYQRKDNIIRFPAHLDDIIEYNYVMYKNNNYSNKWFYAFITNMTYENDGLTNISIETDAFQTWQFDIQYKKCFVEREHVNDDTIGLHTIDENLNVGELICEQETEDISYSEYYWIGISSSWNPVTKKQFSGISIYTNNVMGKQLFLFKIDELTDFNNIIGFINECNSDSHISDVSDMYIIPDAFINQSKLSQLTFENSGRTITMYTSNYSKDIISFNTEINKRHSFSNFSPKNNKCFCFPYNYLFVTNNIGNNNIYKYEDFNSSNIVFKNEGMVTIGGSGQIVPLNYKGMSRNDDEKLPLGKYPTCSWSADSYTNWLTQNAINMPTRITNAIIGVGSSFAGVATYDLSKSRNSSYQMGSNFGGSILSSANEIASIIGDFRSAKLAPNIEGGQNTGDINFSAGRNTFTFKEMRSKNEYLQQIDDFFSLFGYKVNSLKVPNIKGRRNWNYVKTSNCNFVGNIPQNDLQKIHRIFNEGVTFWHKSSTFLDYSQDNDII